MKALFPLFLLLCLYAGNELAHREFLYQAFPWLDHVFHGMGGLVLGMFFHRLFWKIPLLKREQIMFFPACSLIIALGFEWLQFFQRPIEGFYAWQILNTLQDMTYTFAGAFIFTLLCFPKKISHQNLPG